MSIALHPVVKGCDLGKSHDGGIVQLFGQNRQVIGGRKSLQVRQNVQYPVTSHSRFAFQRLTNS
jgi:hypothetical protein